MYDNTLQPTIQSVKISFQLWRLPACSKNERSRSCCCVFLFCLRFLYDGYELNVAIHKHVHQLRGDVKYDCNEKGPAGENSENDDFSSVDMSREYRHG